MVKTINRIKLALPVAAGPQNTLEYFGHVNHGTNERVFRAVKKSLRDDPSAELFLTVTSAGGPTGIAMAFYDTMRHILRPRLTTIGTGDVDSAGVIIFLSGQRRLISPRTTLLFHPAGRRFDSATRYTTKELEAMLKEDRLKDLQYASVVADNSTSLTPLEVLDLMEKQSVLTADDLIKLGLAHEILS